MENKKKVLAIIPARGGSKGIPRKNIKLLNGKPLIYYTIEAAIKSGVIDRLVVSTEDNEIADVAKSFGAEVIKRPKHLAVDTALTEPVMTHVLEVLALEGYAPDYVSLIQCTSPLLPSDVIRQAINMVGEGKFDSCITVFMPGGYEFKWKKGENGLFIPEHDPENRPRRQDLNLPYHENGAFYVTKTELFKKTHNRFGGSDALVTAIEMTEEDSLQIDEPYHFWLADQLLKKRSV